MNDFDLYGKYYERADRGYIDVVLAVIIAFLIYAITQNIFYTFLYIGYFRIRFGQSCAKNRHLEILNKLDEIEQKIK